MSRSIHSTRRALAQLRRQQFAADLAKAELLREEQGKLRRKRSIKTAIREERHRAEPPLAGTALDQIEFQIFDSSAHTHFPLGADDLRDLLARLPANATQGISRIQLSLGKQYIDEQSDEPDGERDPFSARRSWEIFPGVYAGNVLGTYSPRSGRIALHGYVYDKVALESLPLPAAATTAYLRLHLTKTFIHEVAHHHDYTQRVGRGRWIADRTPAVENYAERMEHLWTMEIALPWLEQRYQAETAALLKWLELFGGWRAPLAFFAGDPRTTDRDGLQRLSFSTSAAFESFVGELAENRVREPSPTTRLSFAWELHYADEYDACLHVTEGVIVEAPEMLEAMLCKADTLVHLKRFDEAWKLATHVSIVHPGNSDAWGVRADILEAHGQWQELLTFCESWQNSVEVDRPIGSSLATYRAVAYCAMSLWKEMEHWIEQRVSDSGPRRSANVRRQVFRRAGKTDPAATTH